jgi:hypothetical protein
MEPYADLDFLEAIENIAEIYKKTNTLPIFMPIFNPTANPLS